MSRRRADPSRLSDPAAVVRGFIPTPGTSALDPTARGATDLDVPCYAWANFFACTLERLKRVDSYAAAETASEFLAFISGWFGRYHARDVAARAEWMTRNFAAMARRSLKRRGSRSEMRTSPRHVLFLRNQVAKGNIPATEDQIAAELDGWRRVAQKLNRRAKRNGRRVDIEALLAGLEREWRENVARADSMPRRKLSYTRGLLPFQDALNLVDRPRRGGRPPR